MRCPAEGQVSIVDTRKVKVIGINKPGGVAVGRSQHNHDSIPFGHLLSTHFQIAWRDTRCVLNWGFVPQ